jgi:DNA-binding NarL/FixJ family response regulator
MSRSSGVEGSAALNGLGHPLMDTEARVVIAADDQLSLRRMAAALAGSGIRQPVRALGAEETEMAAGGGGAVVVLSCDVSDPVRMAALRRLRKAAKDALIVLVTPRTDATGVRRGLDAGADGLVFESELEETLAASLVAVAAGQTAVPRRVRGGLYRPAFSHRERQVLTHVAEGLTNSEIADALFLSESTVKSHLSSAFSKLGVRSRKEAAALVLDPDQGLGAGLLATGVPALTGVRTRGAP